MRRYLCALATIASVFVIAFALMGFCALVADVDNAKRDPVERAKWESAANGETVFVLLAIAGGAWLKVKPKEEAH